MNLTIGNETDQEVMIIDRAGNWQYSGKLEDRGITKQLVNGFLLDFHAFLTKGIKEKVIFTPVDPFTIFDPVPKIMTEDGSRKVLYLLVTSLVAVFGISYGLLFYYLGNGFVLGQPSPAVIQLRNNMIELLFSYGFSIGIWLYVELNYHFVSQWFLEPYETESMNSSTDFYLPVLSTKVRTADIIRALENLSDTASSRIVKAVHDFNYETIKTQQRDANKYKERLDYANVKEKNRNFDSANDYPTGARVTHKGVLAAIVTIVAVGAIALTILFA